MQLCTDLNIQNSEQKQASNCLVCHQFVRGKDFLRKI